MRAVKTSVVALAAVFTCAFAGGGASVASAALPWWHLDSMSRPAVLPAASEEEGKVIPGKGSVAVSAANLGDGSVDGSKSSVRILDKLPADVKAVSIMGIAEPVGSGSAVVPLKCSPKPASEPLACEYEGVLPPYSVLEMRIGVEVLEGVVPGSENEVSVSGGGAQSASLSRPLAIGTEPASFGVENYELTPEEEGGAPDMQAGSHPFQLTNTLTLNQNENATPVSLAKDLRFDLPPGLIGNPTPFPQCTLAQFLTVNGATTSLVHNECAEQTAVGAALITVNEPNGALGDPATPFEVPVFNLEPAVGEPARFGFMALSTPVFLNTSVRTGGDYGVTVSVSNISQTAAFTKSEVTFWGVPGDPRHDNSRGWGCIEETRELPRHAPCVRSEAPHPPPLLALPTSCTGQLQSTVQAASWAKPGSFGSFPSEPMVAMGGCNRLPFTPSISVAPDGTAGSTPTGLSVDVHVPQDLVLNPTGLAESQVKDTTVALPVGVALNPASGDGLLACSLSEIALSSKEAPTCPDASKVGTVEIHSPLLPNPLVGSAYVAAQEANPFGSLVALYVFAEDPVSGVRVKLAGEVKPDPVTGQLISTFLNTPQLPFEDFKLHFFGGDRAPLGTPAACGAYTTTASIAPWSGNAVANSASTFDIASGPNGSPCREPLPFAPELTAGSTNIQAGAFTPFTNTMSREDGSQNLQGIQLHMPPGLSGLLTGVKLCGEAQGNAGMCGPESEIGETTVSVGVGDTPFSVKGGRVYITGPYEGAPFGLSIVNPAKAGPYDLEKNTPCDCVVVRAKIEVDPVTAALTITTDNTGPYKIPTILGGIPLQIKHVNVTVTRPGFTFNPTNCTPMAITGSLLSTQGATQALSVPFQVTNCATLGFKPSFKVSTSGKTSRKNGASLNVKLAYPKAPFGSQANIKSVKVNLPKQLPSRLTTLQKACTDSTFNANPAGCPAASRVGTANATTPLLPVPLSGPAYFVSHGGAKFPELIIVLQGYGVTVDLHGETFISKAGITSSTFRTVPDVPVGTFELTLPEGSNSALAANGNFCSLTKTVLVKKRVKVRSKGRTRTVTRKVRKRVAGSLVMPTAFTAQNGAVIHQNTPISVTGCGKAKPKKKKGKAGRHHTHSKKKK